MYLNVNMFPFKYIGTYYLKHFKVYGSGHGVMGPTKDARDSNSENYAWNCKQVYILFIHESE